MKSVSVIVISLVLFTYTVAYSATATWKWTAYVASPDAPVVSIRLYRQENCTGTPVMQEVPVDKTQFVDANVKANTPYCAWATAYSAVLVKESKPSQVVQFQVSPEPTPPTGLQIQ